MANEGRGPPGSKLVRPSALRGRIAFTALVLAAVCATAVPRRPLLLWNSSPSSPIGLYLLQSHRSPGVGDFVAAWPPDGARRLASERGYLPFAVPLVKRVGATAGDEVCSSGPVLRINRNMVARRRALDRSGRPLPTWSGCRKLMPGEILLLSGSPDAFDGRYFGITRGEQLLARATLLWAR
jgi:conjugative transfer signal peptidase TraF